MDAHFVISGRMTWRRAFLIAGAWELSDNDRVRATLTNGTVTDADGRSWRFDSMFLTLTDESSGVICVRAGRDAVLPTRAAVDVVTPSATYTMSHDQHVGTMCLDHDEVVTMSRRRYGRSWTIEVGERLLPIELIVFVMTAIERRQRVAHQFGREDRMSVRSNRGDRDGLMQGPGCALGIVIAVVLAVLVLLSFALPQVAQL
jgi:hypothetical protein